MSDKPKTYPHTLPDGRTVRVTIPPPPTDEQLLADAMLTLREQLSPHTVAAMAGMLKLARTDSEEVNRQIAWFTEQLMAMVGGPQQQIRLADEVWLRQVAR